MDFRLTAIKYPKTQEERDEIEAQKKRARKMRRLWVMHSRSGKMEGKNCGDCEYFYQVEYNCKRYFKCGMYGESRAESTDWRKKWEACGKYEERDDEPTNAN